MPIDQELQVFRESVKSLKQGKKFALSLLLAIALFYPGQNYYQTLTIHDGPIKGRVQGIEEFMPYPVGDGTPAPPLTAYAAVVQDVESKTMMFVKNPNMKLPPASTTKIMTALVALEHYNLEDIVVIGDESEAIGHEMELEEGERITVESLMYGLLVESGNDAAFALATHFEGGYDAFVAAMNEKAQELHLDNTTFKNPSGVEQYGHVTTARDLAVLAARTVQNPIFNRMMQTRSITVTDVSGTIRHELTSTNELLGVVEGVKGMKTGWTENAGECLVTYVERDNKPIITVILKSEDRFGESTSLIDWAYGHHTWATPTIDL